MRGPGEKSGLSRAERSSGGAGGCQRSRRVNLSEPGTCAGVTEQACEQADQGRKPVRAPDAGRAGAGTEAALTLVRVSGHLHSRGRLMPGERTGVQGSRMTQASLPAPTLGLHGEKEESVLPGRASARAPPTPAHQASQPGPVDGGRVGTVLSEGTSV